MAENVELQHPAEEELTAYARGKLDEAAEKRIEEHLLGCEECSKALDSVSDDSIVSLLRRPDAPKGDETEFWPAPTPEQAETHSTLHQDTAAPAQDPTHRSAASAATEADDLPPELADHPRYRVMELLGEAGWAMSTGPSIV